MPKISVVIPVYNKANFIAETLNSVYEQTFTDYEILLINDGSTDGSLEILETFKKENTTVYSQENKGLSHARNTGISLAKAPLICLLDADDLWETSHLENIYSLSIKYPEATLYGTRYIDLFKNGILVLPKWNLETSENDFIVRDFFKSSLFQPIITPSSFGFKKNIISEIGGFNEDATYFEDADFFIRANLKFQLAYSTHPSVKYRFESENQVTHSPLHKEKIPDLTLYTKNNPTHKTLNTYVNLHLYFLCNHFKTEGAQEQFKELRKKVEVHSLNYKQRFLLDLPRFLLVILRRVKGKLLRKGHRITTF